MPHSPELGAIEMEESSRTPIGSRRGKRRDHWLVVGGVLLALAAVLAFAARDVLTGTADGAGEAAKLQAAKKPELPKIASDATSDLIDDDGETLWVSPTDGPPIDLAYLPPGVEIVLALRPAELARHEEGAKVFAALGPLGPRASEAFEHSAGVKFGDVEQLTVGWQVTRDGEWVATLVVRTATLIKPLGEHFSKNAGGEQVTVIATSMVLAEIRELDGHAPPMTRDMERLLDHTDASRTATLLFRPATLLSDAGDVLQGAMAPLRLPLELFLSDDISAAAVSMDWGEDCFMELVAVPTLDATPETLSDALAARVDQLPESVEEFVLSVEPSPYSRRVVARLPEMVRTLAAYTRHGFDRDAAVLRWYLPVVAGHNLLMGADLALAEGEGAANGVAPNDEPPAAEAASPATIDERLKEKTTLRFAREELEAALNTFAADVGVPIEILGPDLQLDGITRNQLFGIDLADRPAEEILVEILRRANPDKLATGPADLRQKLVYVVRKNGIVITTRSAVEKRGERLPAVFRSGQ
jgi:hypothetical protein